MLTIFQVLEYEAIFALVEFKISVFIVSYSHSEKSNKLRCLIEFVDVSLPMPVFISCIPDIWTPNIRLSRSFWKGHSVYNNILLLEVGGIKLNFEARGNLNPIIVFELIFCRGTAFAINLFFCFWLEKISRFERRFVVFFTIFCEAQARDGERWKALKLKPFPRAYSNLLP